MLNSIFRNPLTVALHTIRPAKSPQTSPAGLSIIWRSHPNPKGGQDAV